MDFFPRDRQRAGASGQRMEFDRRASSLEPAGRDRRDDQGTGRQGDPVNTGRIAMECDVGDPQQEFAVVRSLESEDRVAPDADLLGIEQLTIGVEQLNDRVESAADSSGQDIADEHLAFFE